MLTLLSLSRSRVVGLSKLQDVYDLMLENKITGRYVVDTSK